MTRISSGAVGARGRAAVVALALASVLAVILAGFASRSADATATAYYDVTDLGTLGGTSIARDVNEAGQVVGQSQNAAGQLRAFLWENDRMTDLGTLGGSTSAARGIDDSGRVVGFSRNASNQQRAFVTERDADGRLKLVPLGTVNNFPSSEAWSISDSGHVAGRSFGSGQGRAFVWREGRMKDVGALLGTPYSEAWAVSDSGKVVGESGGADQQAQAFIYDDATSEITDIGALLDRSEYPFSEAMNVNASGNVVGWSYRTTINDPPSVPAGPEGEAFLYEKGSDGAESVTPLPPLGGDLYSRARDIDESGRVVGWSRGVTGNEAGQFSAVLWENGKPRDLNSLIPADSGWKLTDAYAINERGQIAGSGFKDGQLRAFLLTDNTPPELQLPADVAREATSNSGAEVHYGSPSASDSVDGSVPVKCDPPSGSTFGLGETTVTCTARDRAGNETTGTFRVTVSYSWSGVLQPVNTDGSSLFKLGRTIPVKFELTGESAGIADAEARIHLSKVSQSVVGTDVETAVSAEATEGNLFRYDPAEDQYVSNLSTRDLSEGTYRLRVDLGDGATTEKHTVNLSLR